MLPKGNHLSSSLSPYLRQHANQPVDWYPWGEEALARARAENKPIILSIGYSSCYWCHVMAREVFSRGDIADMMNANFINIKVDSEERPDIDELYMNATYILHNSGGWPNHVFLTPDLKPFFAGTTFDSDGWMKALLTTSDYWIHENGRAVDAANAVAKRIQEYFEKRASLEKVALADDSVKTLYKHLSDTYDRRNGGFGSGAKFPHEAELLFLLDYYQGMKDEQALNMAVQTFEHMAAGGMYDHVGGGFHRYSTDPEWKVPHFEKMIYSQAMMVRGYTALWKVANHPHYQRIVEDTLAYVDELMTSTSGAYYTSLDAETDAVEGAYYVWNKDEIKKALRGEEYELFKQLYRLEEVPSFKGHKQADGGVMNLRKPLPEAAASMGMLYDDLLEQVKEIHKKLSKVRGKRNSPHLDHKVIAAWNGLMIDAVARAGMAFDKPDYIAKAEQALAFILTYCRDESGHLKRIYTRGKAYQTPFLEDYVYIMQSVVSLYRATKQEKYLVLAKALFSDIEALFLDQKRGGYFFSDGMEPLLVRLRQGHDGPTPSANAVLAHALIDLYAIDGDAQWRDKARAIVDAFSGEIHKMPVQYTHLLHALLRLETLPEPTKEPDHDEDDKEAKAEALKESSDAVSVEATVKEQKGKDVVINVVLRMKDSAWHVNANPASLPSLVPTRIDVQSDTESSVTVSYPDGTALKTPLGELKVFESGSQILAHLSFKQAPEKGSKLRIVSQFQACKDDLCLPPSDVVTSLAL